jgi:hypothetical protein
MLAVPRKQSFQRAADVRTLSMPQDNMVAVATVGDVPEKEC